MRKKIISKIEVTKNKTLLNDIYLLLGLAEQTEDLINLSNDQKKSIKRGLRDISQNKLYTNQKANKEIEKWLEK